MTQYLGICMVIIVTGLVLAVVARLITGGVLEEIERIKKQRTARKLKAFTEVMTVLSKEITNNMDKLKTMMVADNKKDYKKAMKDYYENGDHISDEEEKEFTEAMKELL